MDTSFRRASSDSSSESESDPGDILSSLIGSALTASAPSSEASRYSQIQSSPSTKASMAATLRSVRADRAKFGSVRQLSGGSAVAAPASGRSSSADVKLLLGKSVTTEEAEQIRRAASGGSPRGARTGTRTPQDLQNEAAQQALSYISARVPAFTLPFDTDATRALNELRSLAAVARMGEEFRSRSENAGKPAVYGLGWMEDAATSRQLLLSSTLAVAFTAEAAPSIGESLPALLFAMACEFDKTVTPLATRLFCSIMGRVHFEKWTPRWDSHIWPALQRSPLLSDVLGMVSAMALAHPRLFFAADYHSMVRFCLLALADDGLAHAHAAAQRLVEAVFSALCATSSIDLDVESDGEDAAARNVLNALDPMVVSETINAQLRVLDEPDAAKRKYPAALKIEHLCVAASRLPIRRPMVRLMRACLSHVLCLRLISQHGGDATISQLRQLRPDDSSMALLLRFFRSTAVHADADWGFQFQIVQMIWPLPSCWTPCRPPFSSLSKTAAGR